jgi:L-threonylcarbamoyladenylate synthase
LPSHYAPTTKFIIVDDAAEYASQNNRVAVLSLRTLSATGDLREAAANLFHRMHELDRGDFDVIAAEVVPEKGIGAAINDRLRRAAAPR